MRRWVGLLGGMGEGSGDAGELRTCDRISFKVAAGVDKMQFGGGTMWLMGLVERCTGGDVLPRGRLAGAVCVVAAT